MNNENQQRAHTEVLVEMHNLTCETFLAAIAAEPDEQLHWKPALESRSIAEICRHVIRVEGWFLSQMGYSPAASDPGTNSLDAIQSAVLALQSQIKETVQGVNDDEQLQKVRKAPESQKEFSLDYAVKHMAQHKLYHFSQICYLRRALDRTWQAPLQQWETAVDTISSYTWKAKRGEAANAN